DEDSFRLRYWSSVADYQIAVFPQKSNRKKCVLQCIMPPVSEKPARTDFLECIREQEKTAIAGSDSVYVLGWSVPTSDSQQETLIREVVAQRTKGYDEVVVGNLGETPEYFSRVQNTFEVPRERFRIWNSGFVKFAQGLKTSKET
ncbi:MAG: hypothetical protein MUP80_00680, partial [Acidobacteriia bacterium]|nr:hypothetical protein [Terriglobia bacterium]